MPCLSEYLEPNAREIEATKVARHLLYVSKSLYPNYNPTDDITKNAESAYPDTSVLDKHTKLLCDLLKTLNEEEQNRIIWDGRKREARELAEWWEKHQEFDKEREYQKISRMDEYFMNCLIGYIKTEKELAEKNKVPMDRKKIKSYLETYLKENGNV